MRNRKVILIGLGLVLGIGLFVVFNKIHRTL